MTDHPKPVARYHFDEVRPAGMFEADDGQYVESADHKAALDTLKLALQVECEKSEKLNACIDQDSETIRDQEARIAELVRERDAIQFKLEGTQRDAKEAFANWRDFQQAYSSLRVVIRVKAREWEERASEERADGMLTSAGIYEQFAAELRVLLGDVK